MTSRRGAERRAYTRFASRIPCDVLHGGREFKGFVLDVSVRGLFIKTSADLAAGSELRVILRAADLPPLEVFGVVARRKRTHRAAASVDTGGVGVEVKSAPEGFFQLMAELFESET